MLWYTLSSNGLNCITNPVYTYACVLFPALRSPSSPSTTRLVPAPDVQSHLCAGRHRECRVPCLRITRPIRPQVLPEDGVAFDRLERDPLSRKFSVCVSATRLLLLTLILLIVTLQESTPFRPIHRHLHPGKVRPAARAVRPQIHHERTDAVAAVRRRTRPVVMVSIVARGVVPLCPHALDVQVRSPALERPRALLDAAHHLIAVQQGPVRQASRRIDFFGDAVEDDRGCVLSETTSSAARPVRCQYSQASHVPFTPIPRNRVRMAYLTSIRWSASQSLRNPSM